MALPSRFALEKFIVSKLKQDLAFSLLVSPDEPPALPGEKGLGAPGPTATGMGPVGTRSYSIRVFSIMDNV